MAAEQVILLDSAAYTASGTGAKTAVKTASMMAVVVDCTAVSSGTSLKVWIEGSADGGTTYTSFPCDVAMTNDTTDGDGTVSTNAGAILSLTSGTGRSVATYKHLPFDYIRARWALTGTSYTFSVKAVVK